MHLLDAKRLGLFPTAELKIRNKKTPSGWESYIGRDARICEVPSLGNSGPHGPEHAHYKLLGLALLWMYKSCLRLGGAKYMDFHLAFYAIPNFYL